MPEIGILGGSFNPPHAGHLALARHARDELGLERVWLMPVHTPPHKPAGADPGPEQRLAMARLAVAGEPGIDVCEEEIRRGGPSYTADTLSAIHERHPEAQLTFVVGADTALTLPSWREPERVLALARLAVARRAGGADGGAGVLEAVEDLAPPGSRRAGETDGAGADVVFLEMAPVEASSTLARERIAAGEPTDGLLAPAVREYIDRHGFYRARQPGAEAQR
ncbi:MAG TPA: nicotinate (nicotinamide) nucleotide adenylyltransferase [Solirubrobacteraceae bacterium]|nr:nicotinate (nicotinamide) nucleotide adenylyltransferase [Solirubrobacteraceae bacterium]